MEVETGVLRHYEPTYRMKPYDEQKFSPAAVRRVCEEVLTATLTNVTWNGEAETVLCVSITDAIKQRVRELRYPRYKFVVQVVLGQEKGQGVRVASRCLWDTDTDNYAAYTFRNDTLWCTAMVFGCYTE